MSEKNRSNLDEYQLIYVHSTLKAWGVKEHEEADIQWLPNSQVECETKDDQLIPGKVYTFILPEWLAKEKGFI